MPSSGLPSGPFFFLLSTPSGVFEQRHRRHVQREEAVQGRVTDGVVAANPQRQAVADQRDGAEQRDDDLRAPVGHLSPGKQVAHEGLGHQQHVDDHAEQPHQLARALAGAVDDAAEDVQVHHHEEHRRAGGVQVADQPPPVHVAHDVFDRRERHVFRRLVIHRQEDAGDDLQHQHGQRQRAEEVPEVEILGRVVLPDVVVPPIEDGETFVDPARQAGAAVDH